MSIPFIDLQAQRARLADEIDAAIAAVLAHGRFVLGPEVGEFETALAHAGKAEHALGCANGTDAIILSLMALEIGRGDAVICPSFTFCATAEAIALCGATPVFVDIDRDTYNIDPPGVKTAITETLAKGDLTPRAILGVDLFGQAADYPALAAIAEEHGLALIADSAQAFGSTIDGQHPLSWCSFTTTSFFPAKPLGCYGDGGAVLTDDEELAQRIDSLRIHGKGEDKYNNVRIGLNSRLDTIQAAVLLAKLSIFDDELARREVIAQRYIEGLNGHILRAPHVPEGVTSTWAQFTIEVKDPIAFGAALGAEGIPTARYYPLPLHRQSAYEAFPFQGNGLPNTENCMDKVISLPMHPYLDETTQDKIIEVAKKNAS